MYKLEDYVKVSSGEHIAHVPLADTVWLLAFNIELRC